MTRSPARPTADALASSPLLASISKQDLTALVREARPRIYRAGEWLFHRGDPGDGIFAIVSGDVRIVLESSTGNQVVVRKLRDGDVFGELAVLDGQARTASAVAATPVRSLHIAKGRFLAWLRDHPAAAVSMLQHVAYRLRTTNEQVAEIGLLDVETRVRHHLAQRFHDAPDGLTAGSRLRINQTECARQLGITRESVNKHLARLRTAGVIDVERGVVVLLDPGAFAIEV
jgi:CRP-like cAMP-binding protein